MPKSTINLTKKEDKIVKLAMVLYDVHNKPDAIKKIINICGEKMPKFNGKKSKK